MENVYQAPTSDISTHDDDATQPVKLFNAKGRMGRVRYLAYTVGLPMLMLIPLFIMGMVAGYTGQDASGMATGGGLFLLSVIAFYAVAIIAAIWATIQRCHDFNASGWLTLILIIPFAVLVFWFVPGTKGENTYGLKPAPNKTIHWVGAIVGPLFMILSIVAAVAIPAYQDYVERAKTAQTQSYDG